MNKIEQKNYSRIVIIHSKVQFNEYLIKKILENDIILPIGPEALYEVEKNKLPCILLKDLIDKDEYENARIKSYQRINKLVSLLDKHSITQNIKKSLKIGKYYQFQLQIIIGQIHYNYFILQKIHENFKKIKVLIFRDRKDKNYLKYRINPHNILSEIIQNSNLFSSKKIDLTFVNDKMKPSLKNNFLIWIKDTSLYHFLSHFKLSQKLKHSTNRKKKLLLITSPYDWLKISFDKTFNQIFQIDLFPFEGILRRNVMDPFILNLLNESVKFNRKVIFRLENLGKLISSDLQNFFSRHDHLLMKINPYSALIGSVLSSPYENFIAHLGEKLKKPFLLWQHGERGQCNDPFLFSTELNFATHYFAYGNGVKKFYQKNLNKNRLKKIFTVGSIEKNIEYFGGKKILYCTGKWLYTATPFIESIDPDSRLYEAQKSILEFLGGIAEKNEVILKANNTTGLNKIPFPTNDIKLDYNTPFIELLKMAKLVILDTPSTTLVEASSTKVPIFVLGGRSNYFEKVKELISKRAVWCDTPEILIDKITIFLNKGLYEADILDDSYNQLFGSGCFSKKETTKKIIRIMDNIT